MPLFGAGWGTYWGNPEDHVIILKEVDLGDGAAVTFRTIPNYPQYFKFELDGIDQGANVYVADGQIYTAKGRYSASGTKHVYSINGQGPWANGSLFDGTFQSILFIQARAQKIHLELTGTAELFSTEDSGLAQFSAWAIDSGAVARFQNCRPVADRPTWGELDITMTTDTGVHTVTVSTAAGVPVAEGSRTGDGALTLDEQNMSGVSFTVTLAYTADIAAGDGAVLVAAFPSQFNIYYRTGSTWGSGDFPAVTAASWALGVATLTIGAHSLTVGTTVFVSGVIPAGYNGLYVIKAVTGTTIKYALAKNPGAYTSAGQVSTPTAIKYDDGHSTLYPYDSDTLAAATYHVLVHEVSAEGEESTALVNQSVVLMAEVLPPTNLQLSNPTGDVISWLSPNAGYTYNIYDSGSGGIIPAIPTTTHAAGSGTLTKGLSALGGFTGTRYVVVKSLSGGIESTNGAALAIEYSAGVALLLRPNVPMPSQIVGTNGLTLSVPFSLDTRNQAIAATSVKLFATTPGTPFDYTSPIGSIDLTVAANYSLVALRLYATVTGVVSGDGEYYYAIRADSGNGQSQNVDFYGTVRLTTTPPPAPVFVARPGV